MVDTLHGPRQNWLSPDDLARGLAGTCLPGEPLAHLALSSTKLADRYHLSFQRSFDPLDSLDIVLLEGMGLRFALIHHDGMPEDRTEVFVDRDLWQERDVVDSVLFALGLVSSDLAWRQVWPNSVT